LTGGFARPQRINADRTEIPDLVNDKSGLFGKLAED
jgi:hypothetical protein